MKISDQPPLQIFTIESTVAGKPAQKKESEELLLAPGQLVKGRVVGLTGDGKFLLDVGGQMVTARSLVPLTPGSELWLETGKGGGVPILTLAAKKGAVQDFLKLLVAGAPMPAAGGKELADLFSSLGGKLAPGLATAGQTMLGSAIAATGGGVPDPEAVKVLALLLGGATGRSKELLDLLAGTSAKESLLKSQPNPAADNTAKILAAHQEINSLPPQADSRNFLLFPCFFAGASGWGEWLFSLEQEQAPGKEEQYGLSFFLEMSSLGAMSLQATIAGRKITGAFLLETEKARAHLAAGVPELVHILEKQGYSPVSFACGVKSENIFRQLKEALEEKAGIKRFSLLDVSV
ncbi:MAG: flagellar hook-length control protein FliK [Deltaproteobacteria bacterium]|nr:flagellar hook-length control protein FliK [Deltaproteobacteria bacterium]